MADPDDRQDIEALLAEVDRSLAGGSATRPARRDTGGMPDARDAGAPASDHRGGLARRARKAATAGCVVAGGVWVLFALLPFLHATSGAIGAFIGVFAVSLLLGRGRRR